MASIYDEIDKIKQEGNEYEQDSGNDLPEEVLYNLFPTRFQNPANISRRSTSANEGYIGHLLEEDFGESKYDKGLNWHDLVYEDRSLEDFKARKQG